MNKKGQIFVLMISIFMGIALFTIFISLNNKYSAARVASTSIGSSASAVINTYQKQEAALLYLDLSAQQALQKSLYDLGENGGFDLAECGSSIYPLWNTHDKNCIPDYEENLKKLFKPELENRTSKFNDVQFAKDYEFTVNPSNGQVEIMGLTSEKITLAVAKDSKVKQVTSSQTTGQLQTTYKLYESVKNKVNTFDSTIQEAAKKYDLPPTVLKAQIAVESSGDPKIINHLGCAGLGQFCTISGTAQQYFGTNNVVVIEKEPKCQKTGNFYKCDTTIYSKDDRFVPAKMIEAQAKYLKELSDRYKKKGYTDYFAFGLAAYNRGAGNIDNDIIKTGKDDPSWADISLVSGFPVEAKNYVPKINEYNLQWGEGGKDISLGYGYIGGYDAVIGTFEFEQNFKATEGYNLTVYEELKTFVKDALRDCDNAVDDCIEIKRTDFNSKHSEQIVYMSDCEEGTTKILYDFAENIIDCGDTTSDNCKCKVNEDYSASTVASIQGKYLFSAKFHEFKFGGGTNLDQKPIHWVNDLNNTFNKSFEDEMNRIIDSFEENTGVEIAIISIQSTSDIENEGKSFFNYWGVGKKDEKNGILIIVSTNPEASTIILGEGLNKIITNDVLSQMKTKLASSLSNKKVEVGITEVVNTIITKVKTKYEEEDFKKKSPERYDLELKGDKDLISVKAKTYHINWLPLTKNQYGYSYSFFYKDTGKFDFASIKFIDKQGGVHEISNFKNLSLLKKKDNFSFIMSNDNGKVMNETNEEITPPSDNCEPAKSIFRMCLKTNNKLPVMEDNKLQYKESKIKFALNLIDKVPPEKAENLEFVWLSDIQRVLITWEEKKTVDMATYYEIFYSDKAFTTPTTNLWLATVYKKVNITGNSSYDRLREGKSGNPPVQPITPNIPTSPVTPPTADDEDADKLSTVVDNFVDTSQSDPNSPSNLLKILHNNTLYFEDPQTGKPHYRKYYLLIKKDSIIQEADKSKTNLEYHFGIVGSDKYGNKIIEKIEILKIPISNLCGAVVEYAKEYIGTGYIPKREFYNGWSICKASDANKRLCRTQCGSFVTNAFRYAPDTGLTDSELPKGDGSKKCAGPNVKYRFSNSEELQPGDIFSVIGGEGHTGIYIGVGTLSDKAQNKNCFLKFTPDNNGEQVFIHSIEPVCYNTLEQLETMGYKINRYCRVNACA